MEQVPYDMLFRWFIGLSMAVDGRAGSGRGRVHQGPRRPAGRRCRRRVPAVGDRGPAVRRLLSSEHLSVDDMAIDAWTSMKSFRRKDGGDDDPSGPGRDAGHDFCGDKRRRETQASVTDPDARLYLRFDGQPFRLRYMGHLLIEVAPPAMPALRSASASRSRSAGSRQRQRREGSGAGVLARSAGSSP